MPFVLLLISLVPLALSAQLSESHLPIVVINLSGDIPDEPKVEAFMGIINNANGINHVDDAFTDYEGTIGIELRGQSSLWFPKKQYGIELRNDLGEEIDESIMGLPVESDFVLSAPFSDKSLMRNPLSYILAGEIMDYAPRVRYCELILNGEYKGLYILTEKIKRSASRLDLAKLKEEDISGEALEGGYIVRFDKFDSEDEILWESDINPYPNAWQKARFVASYPKYNRIEWQQRNYIQDYITDFERALENDEFQYQGKHYSEYIDMMSFIDFMLMNEITRNVDGYRISSYMYKDKGNVLKMGPVWDFNLAFGTADYCLGGQTSGWQWDFNEVCGDDSFSNHFWWKRFLEDPNFSGAMRDRWFELREEAFSFDHICGLIDSLQNHIGDAADRNFETWPVLGEYIWPNQFVGSNYQEEIDYLKNWIQDRLEYIDNHIDDFVSQIDTEIDFRVFPNPSSGVFKVQWSDQSLTRKYIEIYDALGTRIERVFVESNSYYFDLNVAPGVYYLNIVDEQNKRHNKVQALIIF